MNGMSEFERAMDTGTPRKHMTSPHLYNTIASHHHILIINGNISQILHEGCEQLFIGCCSICRERA